MLELIVVIVILGVLAALAIPRLTQAAGESDDQTLRNDLAVLRIAIDLYFDQHGAYPGQRAAGEGFGEAGTEAAFVNQLVLYTDSDGRVSREPGGAYCWGPYLGYGIPRCVAGPIGESARVLVIRGDELPGYRAQADWAGWVYNCDTGYIAANSDGIDARGARFDTY